jgi:hypothetical protein
MLRSSGPVKVVKRSWPVERTAMFSMRVKFGNWYISLAGPSLLDTVGLEAARVMEESRRKR